MRNFSSNCRMCEGKHLYFNGVSPNSLIKLNGSEEGQDFRITINKGIMYRYDDLENTAMVIGTLEKADNKEELEDFYAGGLEEDTLSLLYGVQDIYVNLVESTQQIHSYAIQDDYFYWTSKDECADAGKLFFMNDSETDVQQIFFDDDITDDPKRSTVDIRDMVTGETIVYKKAINKYLVKVEPDKAILDLDYFVKKLGECERRRTEELENIDKGISSHGDSTDEKDVNEWERLKQLGTSDYLIRTVLPVVYQGLMEIDIERPQDPVRSFAFFLLKNQNLVKLPEKPLEAEKVEDEITENKEGLK